MRSDTVTKGMQQAPHRSLFNALGMTQEELDRPLIGIVSSYNEIVPGHMNLDKITLFLLYISPFCLYFRILSLFCFCGI